MNVYWFLLEFSKASEEVAVDVPNKFITFDFFLQFLFHNFKFETDVHNHKGSASDDLPNLPLNRKLWISKNEWQWKGEKATFPLHPGPQEGQFILSSVTAVLMINSRLRSHLYDVFKSLDTHEFKVVFLEVTHILKEQFPFFFSFN